MLHGVARKAGKMFPLFQSVSVNSDNEMTFELKLLYMRSVFEAL